MVGFINPSALAAQSNVNSASSKASASIGRLSSGNRIQKASDDVSGLAIGTALRSLVTTLRAALNNASQGSSLLSVADGGLSQISDILQRQKAIASQASSGQLTDANRALLNQEFTALSAEIDRIASGTNFNGVKLLNGALGSAAVLTNTDANAVLAGATTTAAATGQTAAQGTSTVSVSTIEAWNLATGLNARGTGTAGFLDVTDSSGTLLTNSAFLNVNSAVYGQFSSFKLSDVVYGTSAKLTATMNGVEFTGTISSGATSVLISNGNTYMKLGISATSSTFTNASTVSVAQTQLTQDFRNTFIARTQVVQGVDFGGTVLQGATGTTTTGNLTVRLASNTATISNFRYVGNGSAANTSILAVDVNGQTFTATTVRDNITSAAGKIIFASADNQFLYLDLANLTTGITNIRTSLTDRTNFINALNAGIAKAGSGINFAIGSSSTDSVKVSLTSANTISLYNGQTLDVTSATSAANASNILDQAITKAVSLRSTVGALQSRFNFASAATEVALQNQDAARGTLLDTDVSAESSDYASAQVQLQAGIAVLAQANQLPQALLRLIQQ